MTHMTHASKQIQNAVCVEQRGQLLLESSYFWLQ